MRRDVWMFTVKGILKKEFKKVKWTRWTLKIAAVAHRRRPQIIIFAVNFVPLPICFIKHCK